jgi:putative ABC transport system permease protein
MLWPTVLMALREIRRNALRSFLTTLGIVIGVGAVIALVTLGEGATTRVTRDIARLGENLLIVSPGASRHGAAASDAPPFEMDDVEAIRREISGLVGVAPASSRQLLVIAGNRNWRTTVTGTTPEYLAVRGYKLEAGRLFEPGELSAGRPVCVIGQTVREELFGARDPLGDTIRVDRLACPVIGVLADKGAAAMGMDQDDLVLMPLRAFQRRIAEEAKVQTIFVKVARGRPTILAQRQIEELLRERRHAPAGEGDDFRVRDMAEITSTLTSATATLTTLLGAIAAVSLLVGGIGIMNIMLVSVTERTREIGIRLSIGALPREVLLQFLVEAAVLSSLGGAVGMALGLLGSFLAARAFEIPFQVIPRILVIAFCFSALVGVVFGYLPAQRAARLNPIEALRHE